MFVLKKTNTVSNFILFKTNVVKIHDKRRTKHDGVVGFDCRCGDDGGARSVAEPLDWRTTVFPCVWRFSDGLAAYDWD